MGSVTLIIVGVLLVIATIGDLLPEGTIKTSAGGWTKPTKADPGTTGGAPSPITPPLEIPPGKDQPI